MKLLFIVGMFFASLLQAEMFEKGNIGLGVVIGTGSIGHENYTIAGANVDYFIVDDFSLGLAYTGWFGGTPSLDQITARGTYFIPLDPQFRPYIGGFVRENIIESHSNFISYGGRAGLAFVLSRRAYLGLGYIYEAYGSQSIFVDSSNAYPEFIFAFSF